MKTRSTNRMPGWSAAIAAPDRADELERAFKTVPDAFRPVPFWFWNGDPTDRRTVRAQILNMKARGIHGVMPMPIYGLDLPYCEPAWYEMIRYAADVCAEQKMQLWLYDEFHCPSGTCAGRVLREHPEYNRIMLVYNTFKVRGGGTLSVVMRPSWKRYPELERCGEELFADAPPRIFTVNGGRIASVEDYTVEDVDAPAGHKRFPGKIHRLVWRNRGSSAVLHVFTLAYAHASLPSTFGTRWATHEPGYIDVLNPDAVKAFLERTFGGYDRLLKKYYGNVVTGMFTDEPGMGYGMHSKAGATFPYTPKLFNLFQEAYGYDLGGHLVELAEDIGDFRRTRADYRRLVTRLFAENYSGQYARWCERRNLVYTGHFCSEESLRASALMNGDLFTSARRMHIPGMDYLRTETPYDPVPSQAHTGRVTDENRMGGKIVAAKTLAAAAQPSAWTSPGKGPAGARARRVICEANGVPNWSVTLGDFKHLADWLCAMGINLINDNGVPFSVKDIRGCAGRSLSAPWWRWYRRYADYTARLSWIMSAGRSTAGMAVLYPTTAVWAALNCKPHGAPESKALMMMQNTLQATATCLSLRSLEYDFIFEDILRRAAVRDKALTWPELRYRILVLPAIETLDDACFSVITEFQRAGGLIAIVGPAPRYAVGGGRTRVIPERNWRQDNILHLRGTGPAGFEALAKLYNDVTPDPVRVSARNPAKLQIARRQLRDGLAVFMVNHDTHKTSVCISKPPQGFGEEWDPENGRIESLDAGHDAYKFALEPWESKVLVFRSRQPANRRPVVNPAPSGTTETKAGGTWLFEPQSDNLLALTPLIALDFNDIGLAGNWAGKGGKAPWEELENGRARTVLAPDIMAAYWLRMDPTVTSKPQRLLLYQDGATACRVFVNGGEIAAPIRRRLWDPANLCFDLSPRIRTGQNRIVLRVEPSPFLTQAVSRGREFGMLKGPYPAPAVLAGDFIVTGAARIEKLKLPCRLRDGSWTEQGFPGFAGCGRYTRVFRAVNSGRRVWIKLPGMRDVAKVSVNGRDCGTRPWPPYLFEITDALQQGENTILIDVINTFGNVLRKHYFGYDTTMTPAGLLGGCRLLSNG